MLPYNEKKGYKLLSKIQKHLNKSLPTKLKATATYQSKKLGIKFKIKGKAKFLSKKNLVYYSKHPYETCNEDCLKKKIEELRKELSTITNMTKIRIC